jgi:hypothetical protein
MRRKKRIIGWKEWVALPDLGIPPLEAKSDTGAKTSALHAFELEVIEKPEGLFVRFGLHPDRHDTRQAVYCTVPLIDRRMVSDSGGHQELRYVIRSRIWLGTQLWPVELTLTNRENMAYRMLLGREAMRGRLMVDPAKAYLLGLPHRRQNQGLAAPAPIGEPVHDKHNLLNHD